VSKRHAEAFAENNKLAHFEENMSANFRKKLKINTLKKKHFSALFSSYKQYEFCKHLFDKSKHVGALF